MKIITPGNNQTNYTLPVHNLRIYTVFAKETQPLRHIPY